MKDFTLTILESSIYDDKINNIGGHLTQSFLYNIWQKERPGVEVVRLLLQKENEPQIFLQILVASLTRHKKQAFIPHGPIALTKNINSKTTDALFFHFKQWGQKNNIAFFRFDPQLFTPEAIKSIKKNTRPTPQKGYYSVLSQPRYEWLTDISKPEEEILNSLSKNTRYSIRTALKRGTTTKIITNNLNQYFPDFYRLMEETAERANFKLHPKKYYQHIFNSLNDTGQGFLIVSEFEQEILAINLIVIYGGTALFVFGASSSNKREQFATYLAHWAGFLTSANLGAKYYSFGGVSHEADLSWQNVSHFKKQFTGSTKDFGPTFDLVISPFWYYLYIIKKKINI